MAVLVPVAVAEVLVDRRFDRGGSQVIRAARRGASLGTASGPTWRPSLSGVDICPSVGVATAVLQAPGRGSADTPGGDRHGRDVPSQGVIGAGRRLGSPTGMWCQPSRSAGSTLGVGWCSAAQGGGVRPVRVVDARTAPGARAGAGIPDGPTGQKAGGRYVRNTAECAEQIPERAWVMQLGYSMSRPRR